MSTSPAQGPQRHLYETLEVARGTAHRDDPALSGFGGPAGNARLTAWLGAILLVLFVAELVTVLNVRGLLRWHLALGALLIPPALAKTASTTWRILRYYAGHPAYRTAGPPPLLLRLLGPLVIVSTLALLGTGVTLWAIGTEASRTALLTVAGLRIDMVTVHQASFAVWAAATGLHVLARLVPTVQLICDRTAVAGRGLRDGVVLVAVLAGTLVMAWVVFHQGSWGHLPARHWGPGLPRG